MLSFLPLVKPAQRRIAVPRSEKDLVDSLIAKEDQALEILYRSYYTSLLGIVSRITKQEEVAQDILQETFMKIWNSIEHYDQTKGRLFTWMARLAKNKAIDHMRSRGEINSLKNDDLDEMAGVVNERYQVLYNPEHIGLKQLMHMLTPQQTRILDLIYFQGYTQVEVAEMLMIPVGTVKTRIRVSIKTLRSCF